jgi:hypothetical protein
MTTATIPTATKAQMMTRSPRAACPPRGVLVVRVLIHECLDRFFSTGELCT